MIRDIVVRNENRGVIAYGDADKSFQEKYATSDQWNRQRVDLRFCYLVWADENTSAMKMKDNGFHKVGHRITDYYEYYYNENDDYVMGTNVVDEYLWSRVPFDKFIEEGDIRRKES